jgi:hypothetical protein
MSTRDNNKKVFMRNRLRPVREANNVAAIVSQSSKDCGIDNISQLYRHPRSVTGQFTSFTKHTSILRMSQNFIRLRRGPKNSRTRHFVTVQKRELPSCRLSCAIRSKKINVSAAKINYVTKCIHYLIEQYKPTTKFVAFSPQENYIDRPTVAVGEHIADFCG